MKYVFVFSILCAVFLASCQPAAEPLPRQSAQTNGTKQPLISWKVSIDYFPTKWVFFRPNSYNMTLYNFPTQ